MARRWVAQDPGPWGVAAPPLPLASEAEVVAVAQALREARRAGVASFHLSVDAAAHDYMRHICPPHRYWVVEAVDALPARMLALVRLLARPA